MLGLWYFFGGSGFARILVVLGEMVSSNKRKLYLASFADVFSSSLIPLQLKQQERLDLPVPYTFTGRCRGSINDSASPTCTSFAITSTPVSQHSNFYGLSDAILIQRGERY